MADQVHIALILARDDIAGAPAMRSCLRWRHRLTLTLALRRLEVRSPQEGAAQ